MILNYLLVGIGGILGSITRYSAGKFIAKKFRRTFPLATFIINITGAFLLGVVSTASMGGNCRLILADGFLGAYTTFSTFMYEGFSLFRGNKILNASLYISGSIIIGILGFMAGAAIVKQL